MRSTTYDPHNLEQFLLANTVATMQELQDHLGTPVPKTVFRKLKELSYLSSYSHGGRYYTLDQIAQFDHRGLWSYHDVHFSERGTLMSTLRHFVNESHSGYFADELQELLRVSVKESLLRLISKGHVSREKVAGLYGEAWIDFLNSSCHSVDFKKLHSVNLVDSQYQPNKKLAQIESSELEKLIRYSQKWIGGHRV